MTFVLLLLLVLLVLERERGDFGLLYDLGTILLAGRLLLLLLLRLLHQLGVGARTERGARNGDDGESRHGKHDGDKAREALAPYRILWFPVLPLLLHVLHRPSLGPLLLSSRQRHRGACAHAYDAYVNGMAVVY